jgi:hypothetical protein
MEGWNRRAEVKLAGGWNVTEKKGSYVSYYSIYRFSIRSLAVW